MQNLKLILAPRREKGASAANYMSTDFAINKCADSLPLMHLKLFYKGVCWVVIQCPDFSFFPEEID